MLPASIHFEARGRRDAISDIKIPERVDFPLTDGVELVRIELAEGAELDDLESFVKLGADLALTAKTSGQVSTTWRSSPQNAASNRVPHDPD